MAHYCTYLCWQWTILHSITASIQSRELCQAPCYCSMVFLTPRHALSSHPHQRMVWLYWLQDTDSMPNCYTINHPTTLHTHNETHCCSPMTLFAAGKVAISRHLATPGLPPLKNLNPNHFTAAKVEELKMWKHTKCFHWCPERCFSPKNRFNLVLVRK